MAKKVRIENNRDDCLWIDIGDETVTLGARIDEGVDGRPQPDLIIEADKWSEAKKHPAIRGLLDSRAIREFPA